MHIITKNAKNNPKNVLFIFEFVDENDYKGWCSSLFNQAQYSFNPDVQESIENIVEKLVARTDDKYANKEYALSGFLFQDEACELMMASDKFFKEWFAGEFGNPGENSKKKNEEGLNKEIDFDIDMDL